MKNSKQTTSVAMARIKAVDNAALNNALPYIYLLIAISITIQKIKSPGMEKSNENIPQKKINDGMGSLLLSIPKYIPHKKPLITAVIIQMVKVLAVILT
jgi:hypothetical protein